MEGYRSSREKAAQALPRGRELEKRWLKICKDSAAHRMGATYRGVISTCLKWEGAGESLRNGEEDEELNRFVFEVVKELDKCHCAGL